MKPPQTSPRNLFVTGPPGCGKTTFIEKLVRSLERPATGFITREIREQGRRIGFAIVTLDGKIGVMAHEGIVGPPRVGRYGVNRKDIKNIAVPSMMPRQPGELVVVDEVGKMECCSALFRKTLIKILNSPHPVVGSIAQRHDPFMQQIKVRQDVLVIPLTAQNRNAPGLVSRFLEALP